jgi:4-hydroxythreonine-4-phosphate dehydrogenase
MQALYLAIDVYKNRKIYREITKNSLGKYDVNPNQEDESIDLRYIDE